MAITHQVGPSNAETSLKSSTSSSMGAPSGGAGLRAPDIVL